MQESKLQTAMPLLEEEEAVLLPASSSFVVKDAVALGTTYGDFTVTYVGPNFLRLFGDSRVQEQPERSVRALTLASQVVDAELAPKVGPDASFADLFEVIKLGEGGPGRFSGESVTFYQTAHGDRWTPHFYTRGTRLGFGALPFNDAVGWEPQDVFLGGAK